MKEKEENEIEVEIREHSDADFFPEKCPNCKLSNLKRLKYKFREIQDLGTPYICRHTHYERVYFQCKECENVFTIKHPFIPINARYMPGVIKYAVVRVLEKGDSIRRVTQDLDKLYLVKISETTVQRWINEHGEKDKISTDLSNEAPPDNFSDFISLDGTFKSVKVKKTTKIWHLKTSITNCDGPFRKENNCRRFSHGGERRRNSFFIKRIKEMVPRSS
ncbi:MAG: hypothetical protein ACTSRI_21465 [Promethearchaeota archaeon]